MSGITKFIEKVCVQTAVYWGSPSPDGFGGQEYDNPVEISCRWDDVINQVTNNKGEELVSGAMVLLTQEVDVDGYLYLGTLEELKKIPEPIPQTARMIIKLEKTPLFRSTNEFVYVAYVK
jgi:hypothetical protein